MRAVQPCALSCLSTSACLSTSSCTRGSCPVTAASISGVAPSPLTRFTWLGSSSAISLTSWKFPTNRSKSPGDPRAWHRRTVYPRVSCNRCAEPASVLGGWASQGLKDEPEVAPTLHSFSLRGVEASTQIGLLRGRSVIDILKEQ